MRKTMKTLGLCALAALAIVSCKKNDEKADMTTFAATINQPTNDDRTGINSEFKLTWNDPDVIKVFAADGGASADFTTSDGGQTEANFSGHIANSEEGYCAFYPAANVNTEDNTTVTLTLSPNQTYLNGSFGTNTYPMVAKAEASDKPEFTFESPCGLLAIPVKGTGILGSIELTGNKDEKLAGTYTYDMNGTMTAPADYTEDENATKVTLTCGETGLPLNTETAATMYFVLPAVTFSQGFTVVLKGVGDNAPVLYRLSTSKPKKIEAEKYIMMDDVNVSTNTNGVTTNAVEDTEITSTSATLHGSYANVPDGIHVDEVGFYFGTTASFNENDMMSTTTVNNDKTFSLVVEDLTPSTTYYYQAYAKSGTTVYTGVENTFTTGTPAPTVTTGTAEATSATAATGHVTLTNAGSGTVSQIGLCWGTTENPTVNATANNFAAATGQTVNMEYEVAIANLEPATEYHVCGYAKVGNDYYYAVSSVTFTTPAAPTVTTGAAAATSANEATGHVTLTNAGSGTVSQIGLCWGTTENPTVNTTANNFAAAAGQTVNTEYEVAIANLEPATEYHVRGYAKVGDDYYYAVSSVTFTTELPGVESFTGDFENGLPEGWTTIDADGDGHNWVLDTECESAYGYNQSNAGYNGSHMILSGSYHKTEGALHPDNYLVSPKVTLRSGSTFSFYAGAQDYQYPAEHFGVCVSDNGTDWTMVQEWTMTAKGASGNKGIGRDGNTRDQGNWHQYTVDLSAYAGRKYIAIRHFNSSDQFFLNVDNIRLGDPEPGTSFSQNFNNSVFPEGWTTIDADGDGYNWVLTNQMAAYGYSSPNDGHYGTVGMTSGSYHGSAGALTPDNYLVTPKVNLVQGSTFSFWACAQDADYPAEHFGVYVSDNGTSGWTMVQEWTMTAKGASGNKGNGRDGNTRDIGNWYQYTVDLSAYAGEKYIAIRHFNCSDEFFLEVDDILLTVNR